MELSRYYSAALSVAERRAFQTLADAMERGEKSVKLSFAPADDAMGRILQAIQYERPDLFFADLSRVNSSRSASSVTVYPRYRTVSVDVRDRVSAEIGRILSEARREPLQSEQSKCRWIHNYLLKNVRYEPEALRRPQDFPQSYNIDGVFLHRAAVCDGFSKAFQILAQRLGLSVMTLCGVSSLSGGGTGEAHSWNVASIRGQPVHIDATWDNNLSAVSRHARYDYFCLPDAWIQRDHLFPDAPACTTDRFTYFAAQKVLFSSAGQLRAYLKEALDNKRRILYFKFATERPPTDIVEKVHSIVCETARNACRNAYQIEFSVNQSQLCFFYRVTEESGT